MVESKMLAASFLIGALATNAPLTHRIDAQPRITLDVSRIAPAAQLLNGSLVAAAAKALETAESSGASFAAEDRINVSSGNGEFFFSVQSATGRNVAIVRIDSNGRKLAVASRSVGTTVACIPVSYVRAFEVVQRYFLTQHFVSHVTDRDMANYDAVIFRRGNAYHVDLSHHVYGMQTYAGCYDGSGYGGYYVVDIHTLQVMPAAQPC